MSTPLLKCPLCGEVVHTTEAAASRVCPTCGGELDSPKAVKAKIRKAQGAATPSTDRDPNASRPLSPSDAAAASSAGWVPTADMPRSRPAVAPPKITPAIARRHWTRSPVSLTVAGLLIVALGVVIGYFIK